MKSKMIEIKKILLPTDFSESAVSAYRVAQVLASKYHGVIDCIHVIPNVKYIEENLLTVEVPVKLEERILPKLTENAENQLDDVMNRYLKSEYRGEAFVKMDRKPSETITDHAEDGGYDLIVIGARGKHESGMFRGSTTVNVIRSSSLPVLVVDESFDMYGLNSIMIPTDLSLLSFAAVPLAASLAGTFDSAVILFHVIERHRFRSGKNRSEEAEDKMESVYESIIGELENFLKDSGTGYITVQRTDEVFEDLLVIHHGDVNHTVELRTEVVFGGSAHSEIRNHAEESADLLAMTTHGYSGRSLMELGSIAEKISQQVHTPVISVRPAKNLFKDPVDG